MTATRTYVVTPVDSSIEPRLVEATSQAQALRHVALDTLGVKVAGGIEVARLMESGVQLEKAKAE